jgi:beta-lactam-binding protein with PASTA domain
MARTTDFDPTTLLTDPERLARLAEAADAAAIRIQRLLHRQRLGAAENSLARARAAGDTAEIARLGRRVALRRDRLEVAEAQFAVANVARPDPDPDAGQVMAVVTGAAGTPPYTTALLDASGRIAAEAEVNEAGAALFAFAKPLTGLRLQVSDAEGQILYRDAAGFDIAPGENETRLARLSGTIVPPSKPAPETLRMPDLLGQAETVSRAILARLGIEKIETKTRTADGPPGVVIEQSPEKGTTLKLAAAVALVVSDGGAPEPDPDRVLEMPGFVGDDIGTVRQVARRLEIRLTVTELPADAPEGQVTAQDPKAGTRLTPPFAASVTVSAERTQPDGETVVIPELVGLQEERAREIARKSEIALQLTQSDSGRPKGEVVSQSPAAGTVVSRPAAMKVAVSTGGGDIGPTRIDVPDVVGRTADDAARIARRLGLELKLREVPGRGTVGTVLSQDPAAGKVVALPATLLVDVVAALPGGGAFVRRLTTAVARDERFAGLELSQSALSATLAREGADSRARVEELMALDNAEMAERLELDGPGKARTLRSILRGALDEAG